MKKQFKYTSLVAAGAVTLGLVGGTLAWWSASDTETNMFSTAGDEDNFGTNIVEDWNSGEAEAITPGTTVNKDVQVQNTEDYAQFIRVKIEPKFVKSRTSGEAGSVTTVYYETTELSGLKLSTDDIHLNETKHYLENSSSLTDGDWVKDGQFYYYIGKVGAESHTNTLLDSVTLDLEVGDSYKDIEFDVIVTAEAVQASNDAYLSQWSNLSDNNIKQKYASLQSGDATAPVDPLEGSDADTDVDHTHTGADHNHEEVVSDEE